MSRCLVALAVLAAACGKSGDGGPCTTCPSPAIAIGVSSNALTIVQGGNGNQVATITRSGGFTGAVTITTEGAPAGVTATPSNVTTNGAVTTGTITVDVAASVAPGIYNLVTRASGAGVTSVTQPLTLTVTAAPAIVIALSTAAQSVDQGATGAAVTVTITRTNFPSAVTLTVEGAPAGVTALFTPNGTSGNTSALTLQVDGAVPGAVYNLTVHATGTGVTATPAPLALTVTVPASFTLGATAVSIAQGGSGQSQITVTRVNFPGDVTLTLEGAPQGVTAEFNPSPLSGTAGTLDITVGSTVPPQQYTLTVRGASPPLADRTTTFILTVTPFVAVGSYTLSTSPGSVLVATASGGTAFVVNVNRTGGFTGPVTLAATGLLGSLTATITPSVVTGNSAVVSVVPDQSSTVGSTQATITGTTPGLSNKTAQVQIATAVPNMTFDYSACPSLQPTWLAYQDGTAGPWIQLLPQNGKFKIRLTQSKVGLAVSSHGGFAGAALPPSIRLRTAVELEAMSGFELCDQGNPGPISVHVGVVNLHSIFDMALIELGGAQRAGSGLLTGVLPGTHDLVAHSQSQSPGVFQASDRIIFRRTLSPANGGTITPDLDFGPASTEAFAPLSATIGVSGLLAGERVNGAGTLYYITGTGPSCDVAPLFSTFLNGAVSSFTAYGVPTAKQIPTDMHRIGYDVGGSSGPGVGTFRQIFEYVHALTPHTLALGSSLPIPMVTSLPGPTFRLQFNLILPSDVAGQIFINYSTSTGDRVFLDATVGWFGGTALSLAIPEFTGTANFDPATQLPPVPNSNWTFAAQGPPVDPCSGGRLAAASRDGVFP